MTDYIQPPPELKPGAFVIAYLRDSGGTSQEKSVEQQEAVIRAWCETHQLVLTQIYKDIAKSGGNANKRDQFNAMIAMTEDEKNLPDGLILWNFARFARNQKESNFFKSLLRMRGLIIHSLTDPIPAGSIAPIVESVLDWSNEDKRRQVKQDVKRALHELLKAGYTTGGPAPKGYKLVKVITGKKRDGQSRIASKLEPDPELAPLVELAWEMRANSMSYNQITKATQGKLYTSQHTWATHFRNKNYMGVGKAGELEIENHHEAIISKELFEAVQRVHTAGQKRGAINHHRRIKHPSLLSGLAYCLECGAAMIYHVDRKYRCYICGDHDRKKTYANCKQSRRINAIKADMIILEAVMNQILSSDFVESLIKDIQDQYSDLNKIDNELKTVNEKIIDTGRRINRLIKIVEEGGEMDQAVKRIKELKREETELTIQFKQLKAERTREIPQLTPEALILIFETWRGELQSAIQSDHILIAKKLLAQFVQKIELGYNFARISYNYPLETPKENGSFWVHTIRYSGSLDMAAEKSPTRPPE